MKLFQVSQEYMAIVGVCPLLRGEKTPFNRQNSLILFIFGISLTSSTAFFLIDADTLRQYTECFFGWISILAVFVGLILVILKTEKIFQLIDNLEIMIESSEFASLNLMKFKKIIVPGKYFCRFKRSDFKISVPRSKSIDRQMDPNFAYFVIKCESSDWLHSDDHSIILRILRAEIGK